MVNWTLWRVEELIRWLQFIEIGYQGVGKWIKCWVQLNCIYCFVCVCVGGRGCVNPVELKNRHCTARPNVPLPNRTSPLPSDTAVNSLCSIDLGQSVRLHRRAYHSDTFFLTMSSVAGQRRCGTLRRASNLTSLPHRVHIVQTYPPKSQTNLKIQHQWIIPMQEDVWGEQC